MKEKYRIQFFKHLYNLLGLKQYDDSLADSGIEKVQGEQNMCSEEILCNRISQYFYLLNDVDTDSLTPEEISFLERISLDTPESDVQNFLRETYRRVLLSQSEADKIYYGPFGDPEYEADKDAIAIGLKYDHFGLSTGVDKDMDRIDREEEIVSGIVNQIQSNSALKIKVIVYDEMHEGLMRDNTPVPLL